MKGIIEPFTLTQQNPAVTQSDTTAAVMSDWMVYRVPRNMRLILSPGDEFCAEILDTGASSDIADISKIKIETRDAAGAGEKQPVVLGVPYTQVQEFRNEDKKFRLPITSRIELSQFEYLAIQINDATGADKDVSYFTLACRIMR